MRSPLAILVAAVLLSACKEDVAELPAPLPLTEESLSYFCQMHVLEHGGPKAQVHVEGHPAPLFFAQVRDGVAYLKSPERDGRIIIAYVTDMGAAASWAEPGVANWIPAQEAFFVVEADVAGGMGAPEVVPFREAHAAKAFVARHGGRVVALSEIPDAAVLGPLDHSRPLETPS